MAIKRTAMILMVILAVAIGGCAVGNKVQTNYTRITTVGREMVDLKEALDKGAVTQEEYDKLKAEVIKMEKFKFECSTKINGKTCEDKN